MAEKASLKNGGGELSQELWGSRLECFAADGAGLGEDPYRQLAALYGWRVGSTDRDRSGSDCRVEDPSVSVVCLHKLYIYYSCGQRIHGLATTVGIAAGSQVPQAFAIAVYSD